MAGNVWSPENASRNLALTDHRSTSPNSRTPEELRLSLMRQFETGAKSDSQDDANGQGDTNPFPLTLDNIPAVKPEGDTNLLPVTLDDNLAVKREEDTDPLPVTMDKNPAVKREGDTNPLPLILDNSPAVKQEESEEEGGFDKAGCEGEFEKSRQEFKVNEQEQGCEEDSQKDSEQESQEKTEQDTGEYAQGYEEDYEEAYEQVARKYAQGYGEDYDEDYQDDSEEYYEEAGEEDSGGYPQGYEEYYEEAGEEDGEVANFTSSHKQTKHKTPSGRCEMGKSVKMENRMHTTLRCSHCREPHRKVNCPELPCSHCKLQGHVSLLCAERLAKNRKNKITEMRNRRKREAEGPAPVASGDTSQQSEKKNAENPRKRKSRRPPSTPPGSDHDSASDGNGHPSSPQVNQDSDDDGQASSASAKKKTQEQEKTTRPMRCSNCMGPHRKRICPHLPCAYCNEAGHTSGACPERLLKQQKTKTANMREWRKSEARGKKGKTGGDDDSKGVGGGDGGSDHDKSNPPPRLRCSVCKGPHRKPACPDLPCAYCGEQGHVRHDCPKRLADREERVASRKRQKKSTQD